MFYSLKMFNTFTKPFFFLLTLKVTYFKPNVTFHLIRSWEGRSRT